MSAHEIPTIEAASRDTVGTRAAQQVRTTGHIPAVIYGRKKDPLHVTTDSKTIQELIHHHAHVLNVDVAGTVEPCLIKAVQWDHLGSEVIHLDLARIDLTEKVAVEVEIVLEGEPAALEEEGAILDQMLNMIEIECLATDIPESITVDVSQLELHQTIAIGDITMPEGVETTMDPETPVASISIVQEVEEPEEGEVVEGEEPEVIGAAEAEGEEGEEPAEEPEG